MRHSNSIQQDPQTIGDHGYGVTVCCDRTFISATALPCSVLGRCMCTSIYLWPGQKGSHAVTIFVEIHHCTLHRPSTPFHPITMARKASEEGQHDEKSLSSVNREHAATIEEEGLALGFDAVETSKLLRKVDYRLIPVLAFLYLLAFLDRSNLGNAKVAGLEEDLQLTGTQYNLAATVFFFPYCLLEIPANVMLKLLRPSRWIGCLVIAWGTVTTCTGSIESYHGLIISRGEYEESRAV